MKYRFIDSQKARVCPETGDRVGYPISLLCQVLEVPESSYYDWNATGRARAAIRSATDEALTDKIRFVHAASDSTYGAPRVTAELRDGGTVVSKRRVAELMRTAGIQGLSGREHSTTTTRRDRLSTPVPDLVERMFQPAAPDLVWYGDITYIWIERKFYYLATVIDACTKQVIGWALADHMRTELVSQALKMAVSRRGGQVNNVIFHTDRGSQYTSNDFRKLCTSLRVRQSMGRTGICYDNAAAESFFSTFKRELVDRYWWDTFKDFRQDVFEWIETWYNSKRRHTSINMKSPNQAYLDHINGRAA